MGEMDPVSCCCIRFWFYVGMCFLLVAFGGLMSGLTLGLMSLGLVDLEVLKRSGSETDKRHAIKILPVVQKQHLLLVTLLLGNALAAEALPIFLNALMTPYAAILMSVSMILLFGEIMPQAVCARYGLAIGAFMAPFVRMLIAAFIVVAWPLSKLLDSVLGTHHRALFRRAELKALVNMHGESGGELSQHETSIITGALDLYEKTAGDAMTPLDSVFCLDIFTKMDLNTMKKVLLQGHSRVPVYAGTKTNIVGILLVKCLLTVRPEDETPLFKLPIRKVPRVGEDMPLYDILKEFQRGHSHMAIVVHEKQDDDKLENLETSNGTRQGTGVDSEEERLAKLRRRGLLRGILRKLLFHRASNKAVTSERSSLMFGNPAVVGGGDGTTSSGVTVVPPAEGVGAPRGKRLSNAGGMQRVGKFSTRAAKFFDENIFWVFRNREGEEEASQSSEETSDGSGAAEGRLLLPNKKSKGNDANESPRPVFQQMMIGGGIGSRLTETGRSIVHGGPCNHPVLGKVLPNATRGPLSESQVEGALRDSTKAANDTLRGNVLHMSATRLENSVDLPNAGGPPVSSACAHPIGKLSNAGPFHQADSVSSVGVENTELSGCGGTVEGIDSKTNITSREVQCSPFSSVHVFPGGGCNTAAALHPGHTSGTDFGKNEFSGSLRTREMDPKDPRSPLLSLRSQPGNEPGSNEGDTGGSIDLVSCPVNCWGHSKGLTLDGAEDASFDVGCSQKDSGFEAFERYLAAGSSDVWGRRERESGAQWLNRGLHFGMTAGNEAQGATSVSHRIENGDERYSSRLNPFVNFETSGALSVPKDEEATGIITLEDVIEELLQEEILDEADHYHDIEQRIHAGNVFKARPQQCQPGSGLTSSPHASASTAGGSITAVAAALEATSSATANDSGKPTKDGVRSTTEKAESAAVNLGERMGVPTTKPIGGSGAS